MSGIRPHIPHRRRVTNRDTASPALPFDMCLSMRTSFFCRQLGLVTVRFTTGNGTPASPEWRKATRIWWPRRTWHYPNVAGIKEEHYCLSAAYGEEAGRLHYSCMIAASRMPPCSMMAYTKHLARQSSIMLQACNLTAALWQTPNGLIANIRLQYGNHPSTRSQLPFMLQSCG